MLFHTENETTAKVGSSIATVICDSNFRGNRIVTLELVYPRYIHSELMTHRVFSRNASSSRATPIEVMIDEVKNDPVFFDFVGCNKSGMVAEEELPYEDLREFETEWRALAWCVADTVHDMYKRYNIHKQTLNRALEPFSRIRTLVTATEWENFFKLRLAKDAQPEMRNLALAIREAIGYSESIESKKHLPYVKRKEAVLEIAPKLSVARCARVSYARLDGKKTDIDSDIALFNRLESAGHMSPFEHVAYAVGDSLPYDNYRGWMSLRHVMSL